MRMVPKVGVEPTWSYLHYALNVARLPFRHFGTFNKRNYTRGSVICQPLYHLPQAPPPNYPPLTLVQNTLF